MSQPEILKLAHRLGRRQSIVQRSRTAARILGTAGGVAFLAATVQQAWLPAFPLGVALTAVAALTLLGLGLLWWRTRPNAQYLLGLADRQVQGAEQLGTTYELETEQPRHPFLPLLHRRVGPLIPRVTPPALLPFSLRGGDVASLVFALFALGVYLLPASLLVVSSLPGPRANSPVAEQGRLMEDLADQLEEIARRERFTAVEYLADEIREESENFQEEPLSAREAADRLQYLAGLADLLESLGDNESQLARTFDNAPGLVSDPDAARQPGVQRDPANDGAGSPQRGGTSQQDEAGTETAANDTPEAGSSPPGADEPSPEAAADRQNDRGENLPQPRSQTEQALLQSAKRTLEQAAEALEQQQLAQDRESEPGESGEPDAPGQGDSTAQGGGMYQQDPELASAEEMGWQEPPRANPANSGAMGDAPEQRPGNKPGETDYKDSRLQGMDSEAESQVVWVKERPEGTFRKIEADGQIPTFEQRTTHALEQATVPHTLRSQVKQYFMRLEALGSG